MCVPHGGEEGIFSFPVYHLHHVRHALLPITSAFLLPLPGLGRWLPSCPSATEHTQLLCVNHRPRSSIWRPSPNTLLAFLSRKSCFGCPSEDCPDRQYIPVLMKKQQQSPGSTSSSQKILFRGRACV